jgi:Zn finger protein HypA/HybF involved in hydrogenase expression
MEHPDLETFICKACGTSIELNVHQNGKDERVWNEEDMICPLCGSTELE